MEPTRDVHATLVDLLDRILDKGLVINADIVISVAGIPLLGVNLRAALAGMETMLKYGLMRDLDERIRTYAQGEERKNEPSLDKGEKVVLHSFGSCWFSKGICHAWRPGQVYLTNRRLLLFRREPYEILFETPLHRIRDLLIMRKRQRRGEDREELHVLRKEPEETAIIHAKNTAELKKAVEDEMEEMGLPFERSGLLKCSASLPQAGRV